MHTQSKSTTCSKNNWTAKIHHELSKEGARTLDITCQQFFRGCLAYAGHCDFPGETRDILHRFGLERDIDLRHGDGGVFCALGHWQNFSVSLCV